MRTIQLTQGKQAIVSDEDFVELSVYNWHVSTAGYARRKIRVVGKSSQVDVLMHRQVIGAKSGQWVDHINGDRLDNRRSNLRFCSRTENVRNQKPQARSRAGLKGVSIQPSGRYRAVIRVDRVGIHLGIFNTPEEAAAAYDTAAIKFFGEFAKTNT